MAGFGTGLPLFLAERELAAVVSDSQTHPPPPQKQAHCRDETQGPPPSSEPAGRAELSYSSGLREPRGQGRREGQRRQGGGGQGHRETAKEKTPSAKGAQSSTPSTGQAGGRGRDQLSSPPPLVTDTQRQPVPVPQAPPSDLGLLGVCSASQVKLVPPLSWQGPLPCLLTDLPSVLTLSSYRCSPGGEESRVPPGGCDIKTMSQDNSGVWSGFLTLSRLAPETPHPSTPSSPPVTAAPLRSGAASLPDTVPSCFAQGTSWHSRLGVRLEFLPLTERSAKLNNWSRPHS